MKIVYLFFFMLTALSNGISMNEDLNLRTFLNPTPLNDTTIYVIKPTEKPIPIQVEPYQLKWSQLVIEPNGAQRKGINTIEDEVVIKEANNQKYIYRTVTWTDVKGNFYSKKDKLDYLTLAPISIDIRWNPTYVQHTDFTKSQLISTSLKNELSAAKLTVTQLVETGFTWSSDGFMLLVSDYAIGDKFALQTINGLPHKPSVGQKNFEVIGHEQVNIEGIGAFETKKITTIDNGNILATYWLTNSRPYIVKVRFDQADGQTTIWKITEFKGVGNK